jgi:hypothetical protein
MQKIDESIKAAKEKILQLEEKYIAEGSDSRRT